MKTFLPYLKYVLRHKWFVYQAGRRLGVGRWQLLTHDWSKFLPSEWAPYARLFYGGPHTPLADISVYEKTHHWEYAERRSKESVKAAFNRAWLLHIHRQPHHWQHWLLQQDDGDLKVLEMPERYVREMVADWRGAGMAQGKRYASELREWYVGRAETMRLHERTRARVMALIDELDPPLELTYEEALAKAVRRG